MDGDKKDAKFIIIFFNNKVEEFDPAKQHICCFFFDGVPRKKGPFMWTPLISFILQQWRGCSLAVL